MSAPKASTKDKDVDSYMLGRDYYASARLAMLHLLIHAQFGYLIHPSIKLPSATGSEEPLRIADVGTGTGIWIGEVTRELPDAHVDGFDISDEQYPPESWYGPNASLSKLDIFKPLPEKLKKKYDVVHLRFFMTIASDDNIQIVISNLKDMLKPGGYLQWVERDWMSKFPEKADSSDDPHTQITCYHRSILPRNKWINSLPTHFQQCGLEVLDHVAQAPLPPYRKPWNEDCLIGWAAIGDMVKNPNEKLWYKERLAEAAENAKKGWYVDWELVICVGRKSL
ncbi:MAG: hypothetical protein Q9161_008194 [Pseudevernia consocians]